MFRLRRAIIRNTNTVQVRWRMYNCWLSYTSRSRAWCLILVHICTIIKTSIRWSPNGAGLTRPLAWVVGRAVGRSGAWSVVGVCVCPYSCPCGSVCPYSDEELVFYFVCAWRLLYQVFRVRINYRRILQNHIFTNTEQKYMMLPPFERGMFAVL
jgi:hypothetical protein